MCSVKYVLLHGYNDITKNDVITMYALMNNAILHNQSVQCVQILIPSVKECIMQLLKLLKFCIYA